MTDEYTNDELTVQIRDLHSYNSRICRRVEDLENTCGALAVLVNVIRDCVDTQVDIFTNSALGK